MTGTVNSAEAGGIKDVGKIAPGMTADIVAMPHSPLEDIHAVMDVRNEFNIHGRPSLPSVLLPSGITGGDCSHTSGLGLQREAAGPDGIRWSIPDQLDGLLLAPS
jgi:hypothetical protein